MVQWECNQPNGVNIFVTLESLTFRYWHEYTKKDYICINPFLLFVIPIGLGGFIAPFFFKLVKRHHHDKKKR